MPRPLRGPAHAHRRRAGLTCAHSDQARLGTGECRRSWCCLQKALGRGPAGFGFDAARAALEVAPRAAPQIVAGGPSFLDRRPRGTRLCGASWHLDPHGGGGSGPRAPCRRWAPVPPPPGRRLEPSGQETALCRLPATGRLEVPGTRDRPQPDRHRSRLSANLRIGALSLCLRRVPSAAASRRAWATPQRRAGCRPALLPQAGGLGTAWIAGGRSEAR